MLRAALLTFTVAVLLQPLVIRELTRRAVLDLPSDRSNHTVPIPRGGGIAVLAAVVAGVLVGGDPVALALLAGVLIAAGAGAVEDLRGLPIATRLLLTTVAAAALLVGLVAHGLLSGVAGGLVLVIAVPWSLAVVNATNFMDGINGISAATAIVAGSAYALLGGAVRSEPLVLLGSVVAAAGLGFAPYNMPRARVFLGDVGSYGIGAALAALSLLAVAEGLPVAAAVAPLALYLADTGATLLGRVRAGEPWRLPHKRHAYQRLVALGLPHTGVSALVAALTTVCAGLGAVTLLRSPTASLLAGVALLAVLGTYLSAPRLLAQRSGVR